MEPGGAAQEAHWSSFSAAAPPEESEIMAQLLGPSYYTSDQAQKDQSFGLPSMSWSSDHASDSYYSSSENVNGGSKSYYWSQGSDISTRSFFGHSCGYERYYLSEPNAAPAINTGPSYFMIEDQLIDPALRLIPNAPFGDPTGTNEETGSDDVDDSSLNLSEAIPSHVQVSLPKRKCNPLGDDHASDISKLKKAKTAANVPKNAKKAKSKRSQNTTKSCDEEDSKTTTYGQSSCSCFSEDDSNAGQNGGGSSGKPRAGRGSATDPQSLYARKRRERINERLRILQNLVPNGTKVDISTMLEEAVQYVKFLQLQIKLLSSDELWMYAPIAYNGMNIGLDLKISPPQ